MNAARPMTLGELADRAVTRVASQWLGLLIVSLLWVLPGTLIGIAIGTSTGRSFGQFINGVLGILLVPAAIGLLAGVVTSPLAALRYGVGRLFLSLRCAILSGVTYGIAAVLVNRLAAAVRLDGYAVMFAVYALGYVLIAPLFLVTGLMYAEAMLDVGRATNAFGIAWSRGFRADPRRGWFLGAVVQIAILVGAMIAGIAGGFADRALGTVYIFQTVVNVLIVPASVIAQMAFCIVLQADLRLRYAGDDLEALIDAPDIESASPAPIVPGVTTSQ